MISCQECALCARSPLLEAELRPFNILVINFLTHIYRIFVYLYHSHPHRLYNRLFPARELRDEIISKLYEEFSEISNRLKEINQVFQLIVICSGFKDRSLE
ncbi:hypothetical protein RIR_jg22206.t1 [Rhizophagus irregularis DAOM 181602=DAOM 197198]|nr:hypothetical protein RIR_jg22206.t1 [Rhizophagus irregularis DAOM 181602=DAOM 197198]